MSDRRHRLGRRARAWCAAGLLACAHAGGAEPPADEAAQTLRLIQPAATNGLDPHLMDTLAGHSVLINLFEALVETDSTGRVRPGLARSWQQKDALRWVFHLQPGVRFHDGRPLGAGDVVASLERAKNHARSQVSSYAAAIDDVRSTGETSLEIKTRHPTPTLLLDLAHVRIVPADSPLEIEHPVGTGPYRLLDYLRGHGVSLRAFDGYWRQPPAEKRVDFFFIADGAERARWLLDGRADVAQRLEIEQIPRVESSPRHEVRSHRSQEVFYVHLDSANPPFDDRRVRCAVDLAIDRQALADTLLDGRARPAGQMVGAGSFGYSPNIEATKADRERARALLEDAGRATGTTLILYHPTAAANVALALREQLREVGIQVALRGLVWHEFFDLLRHAKLPAYLAGWSESTFDASGVFESLVHTKDPERGFGDTNFTGYSRPSIDRRIDRAAREMDPDARRRLLEEISEQVRADCAFLPLVWPLEHYGVGTDIEWTPRLDGMLRAVDMRRRSR